MAKTKHVYNYDGYTVGDRLLEDVMFSVEIDVEGNAYTLGDISPAPDSVDYLKRIKWKTYVKAMRKDIEGKLSHLASYAQGEGSSLEKEIASFEADENMPGIQILDEV